MLLKEAIRKKTSHGGSIVVVAGDILTAFDAMRHNLIEEACGPGLDVDTRIATMKQYHHKHAYLSIPGGGDTEAFPFVRGGWLGGINTPDLFNQVLVLRHQLDDIVIDWERRGMGITFDGQMLANHIFFADNGFVLADTVEDGLAMMQQITDRLYSIGFEWKPTSLQIMLAGDIANQSIERCLKTPFGTALQVCQVTQMEALGTLIDNQGKYTESVDFRLTQAERVFQKHRVVLCGRGSPGQKLAAWESTVATSAAFGSGAVPLTRELAHHVHAWENRLFRQSLRLRPWQSELDQKDGYVCYLQRTSRFIDHMRSHCLRPALFHLMLRGYFWEAWKEKVRTDRDGQKRTQELRLYRSAKWWHGIRPIPFHVRKLHGWVHARVGTPLRQWEDLMVEMGGVDWRTWRDTAKSMREWMRWSDDTIDVLCGLWDLPSLPKKQPPQ